MNSTENLWDYKRTAEFIGVAPATIYNWVYQRRIPYLKINNDLLRFDPDEIREWILKNRNGTEDNSHCPPAVDGD